MKYTKSTATFSDDKLYRYALDRQWDDTLPSVLFVGLNPSTADADKDDATIRREVGFAKLWGFGAIIKVNLYGFRSTDPEALTREVHPIGANNDDFIAMRAKDAASVVCAWGAHQTALLREKRVVELLERAASGPLMCFGLTKDGAPKHPLRLAKTTPLIKYERKPR